MALDSFVLFQCFLIYNTHANVNCHTYSISISSSFQKSMSSVFLLEVSLDDFPTGNNYHLLLKTRIRDTINSSAPFRKFLKYGSKEVE